MSVCLHCGEIAEEGALFCTKCGYTLPQAGTPASPSPNPVPPPGSPPPPPGYTAPAAVVPPRAIPPSVPMAAYVVASSPVPGALGPIPPPPNAKYCRHCGTVISVAAVYCPLCQQPQG